MFAKGQPYQILTGGRSKPAEYEHASEKFGLRIQKLTEWNILPCQVKPGSCKNYKIH